MTKWDKDDKTLSSNHAGIFHTKPNLALQRDIKIFMIDMSIALGNSKPCDLVGTIKMMLEDPDNLTPQSSDKEVLTLLKEIHLFFKDTDYSQEDRDNVRKNINEHLLDILGKLSPLKDESLQKDLEDYAAKSSLEMKR